MGFTRRGNGLVGSQQADRGISKMPSASPGHASDVVFRDPRALHFDCIRACVEKYDPPFKVHICVVRSQLEVCEATLVPDYTA